MEAAAPIRQGDHAGLYRRIQSKVCAEDRDRNPDRDQFRQD